MMQASLGAVFVTSLIYHGAHTVGQERWANEIFMKYDVATVIVGACLLVLQVALSEAPHLLLEVFGTLAVTLGLWLLTFNVLKGLPFNVIGSVLHAIAWCMHARFASHVCA
jgi:hypothetical protein